MQRIRAGLFGLAAALALSAGLSAGLGHAADLEKPNVSLAVGGKTLVAYLPLTIAERRGYFTKEGLNVEISDFQGGGKALEALVGGSTDFVCGAYEHTLFMAAKGLSIKALALQANSFGLVVGIQKDKVASYHTLTDLKGMKIGVTGPGSASAAGLTMLLSKAGLTANDVSINVAGNSTNVTLAKLTWFNSATISDDQLASFGVHYNLTIDLGGGHGDSETFDLTITNPTNPPGDVISSFTLGELNALDLTGTGWTINNLHYVADSGTTLCGNNNTSWCNPEGNTGSLYILGNFTQNVQNVPEPLTISLFSVGLAGVAAMRRRKQIRA